MSGERFSYSRNLKELGKVDLGENTLGFTEGYRQLYSYDPGVVEKDLPLILKTVCEILFVKAGEQIAGFGVLDYLPNGEMEVSAAFVFSEYRRQKVYTKILQQLIERARQHQAPALSLTPLSDSHDHQLSLLIRLGFELMPGEGGDPPTYRKTI